MSLSRVCVKAGCALVVDSSLQPGKTLPTGLSLEFGRAADGLLPVEESEPHPSCDPKFPQVWRIPLPHGLILKGLCRIVLNRLLLDWRIYASDSQSLEFARLMSRDVDKSRPMGTDSS